MGPPSVFANLGGLAGAYSFEQNIAQPRCVASVKAESLPEYPGLVPAAWVQWVQAIVLDFADIEDRLIAQRQTRHDRTLASHAVWCKHVSSSDPEKGGEHLDAQSRFRLDNQSATAKQKFPSSSAVARLRTFHVADVVTAGDVGQRLVASIAARDHLAALVRPQLAPAAHAKSASAERNLKPHTTPGRRLIRNLRSPALRPTGLAPYPGGLCSSSRMPEWYQTRTTGAKLRVRKPMIVALARKLLIALWRYVTTGVVPAGVVLRAAT